MTTCVVGLGKIGLPLAVQIASKGEDVIGCDINSDVVDLVNKGQVPFPGEANLSELLNKVCAQNLLKATTNTKEAVTRVDSVIIVVPVIVDEDANPDFSAIDSATLDIATGLQPNTLICYETTLPIGTRAIALLLFFRKYPDWTPKQTFTSLTAQSVSLADEFSLIYEHTQSSSAG